MIKAARTPKTIPAIAPGLNPALLDTAVGDMEAPSVAIGAWNGTVVVAVPVAVTIITVLLVGRIYADADVVAGTVGPKLFEL